MSELQAPRIMTKSSTKALECHLYWIEHYVKKTPVLRQMVSPLADVGTWFHTYRRIYLRHLLEVQYERDPGFVEAWLKEQVMPDEARKIIASDMWDFRVDPALVMGIELGLSVDADMRPLERQDNCEGPFYSSHPDATDSGTIDLLLIDRFSARCLDAKSGYSTAGVHALEPPRYAGLIFAHFPQVEDVEFVGEFTRVHATKRWTYSRKDLPRIQEMFRHIHTLKESIVEQYNRGEAISVNAQSGLCPWCSIAQCPIKLAVESGVVDLPPLQTLEDAQRVAGIVYLAQILGKRGRDALKQWIDQHGPIQLANEWEARIDVQMGKALPLKETLAILGLEILPSEWVREWILPSEKPKLGEITPAFQIPMRDLALKTSKLSAKAKTKMRAGLADALTQIATINPKSVLRIGRPGERLLGEDEDGE